MRLLNINIYISFSKETEFGLKVVVSRVYNTVGVNTGIVDFVPVSCVNPLCHDMLPKSLNRGWFNIIPG